MVEIHAAFPRPACDCSVRKHLAQEWNPLRSALGGKKNNAGSVREVGLAALHQAHARPRLATIQHRFGHVRQPATRYNIALVRPRPPARDCRCSNGCALTAQRRSSARIRRLSERPPCHICTGTRRPPCHICTGTRRPPCRICTGTRRTPGTFSTLQQTTSTWQPIFDHLSSVSCVRACVSSVCIRCAHSRDVPVPHLRGCMPGVLARCSAR